MKQKLIGILIVLVLAGFILAENSPVQNFVAQQSEQLKGKVIPEPFGSLFNNEKVNIHLKLNNNKELIFGLSAVDRKFEKVQAGEFVDPSLKIYLDETTLLNIYNSKTPAQELKKAFDENKITYSGVGIYNKMKFGILSVFMRTSLLFAKEKAKEEANEKAKEKVEEKKVSQNATAEVKKEESTVEVKPSVENKTEEIKEENKEKVEIKEEKKQEATAAGPKTYLVNLTNSGFDTKGITIKVGDTVQWDNLRTRNPVKGMIVGAQVCSKVRSSIFNPGESFKWTFTEPLSCVIVDGIYTTQLMNLNVVK